jgi:NADH-quinone oxidoreductase subunit G
MLATELAERLGGDLGFESVDDVWDEIERLAPAHEGATLALLRAPGRVDGVVVPPIGDPAAGARTLADVIARDPSAADGPPNVPDGAGAGVGVRVRGIATHPAAPARADIPDADGGAEPAGDGPVRPEVLRWVAPAALAPVPPRDAYSLRLVSGRALYDPLVVSVARSRHLATLPKRASLRVNPFELERLGVASGQTVRLTSARGSVSLPALADGAVPRGTASLVFNLSIPGAAELIDSSLAVTEVRLERT